jgi:hypothetical protein
MISVSDLKYQIDIRYSDKDIFLDSCLLAGL